MGTTTLIEELEQAADDAETLLGHLYSRGFGAAVELQRPRAAALRARAARVRESLASIEGAAETPQNRAVKAWLLDLTGPLADVPGEPAPKTRGEP